MAGEPGSGGRKGTPCGVCLRPTTSAEVMGGGRSQREAGELGQNISFWAEGSINTPVGEAGPHEAPKGGPAAGVQRARGRRTCPQRGSMAVGLQHVQATDSGFYLMNTRNQF